MKSTSNYVYNLSQKFNKIVLENSNKVAIEYPNNESFTFGEIDILSNKLSNYLINKGLKTGDVIAIINEKSIFSYSLMIACIKTGIIYCNIDRDSPIERTKRIFNNCLPKIIFVDQNIKNPFPKLNKKYNFLFIDKIQNKIEKESNYFKIKSIDGNSPVYIMFTSGSTGFPKGAVMSNNNLINFIYWGKDTYQIQKTDILTNLNPIYFDNSVFDFYISIFNGARLLSISHQLVKNPTELIRVVNLKKCTIWFSVPSLLVYLLNMKILKKTYFKSIRSFIFGGEGFPKRKLKELFVLYGTNSNLYNVYGPTECTCICSSYKITSADFENMNELAPLGFISSNFDYEILSNNNQNYGELSLRGPCVGLGYYNDIDRTNHSFIQNPKSLWKDIMYKTGDIVEKDKNGILHFKGRIDNQIKHMGYRIELEEIEAAFYNLKYVLECGVIYKKINSDLGYILAVISISYDKSKEEILDELDKNLPKYMIPKEIILVDKLIKNQNGKIDRNYLKKVYG
tara:strand:+ start:4145 stop:5677 length:1533 start_codon:yes stop_codon:yes gene_type:complete